MIPKELPTPAIFVIDGELPPVCRAGEYCVVERYVGKPIVATLVERMIHERRLRNICDAHAPAIGEVIGDFCVRLGDQRIEELRRGNLDRWEMPTFARMLGELVAAIIWESNELWRRWTRVDLEVRRKGTT